jgi:hypothetical protein
MAGDVPGLIEFGGLLHRISKSLHHAGDKRTHIGSLSIATARCICVIAHRREHLLSGLNREG